LEKLSFIKSAYYFFLSQNCCRNAKKFYTRDKRTPSTEVEKPVANSSARAKAAAAKSSIKKKAKKAKQVDHVFGFGVVAWAEPM